MTLGCRGRPFPSGPEALNGKLLPEGPRVPNRSAKLAQLKARCGCKTVFYMFYLLGEENHNLCMLMDVYTDLYSMFLR